MIAEPPPDAFLTEILEQPEAIRRAGGALEEQALSLDRVAERSANASLVVLTGMASSYDACLGLASILGRSGVMAVTVNTAELVHFRFGALGRECLVVAVSQSGESAEVVRLAERMRSAKGASGSLVAVTNGRGNPLADMANETIDTVAGTETGPSTKTFGTSLVALSVLARLATDGATVARTTTDLRGDAKRASLEAERLLEDATTGASELLEWLGDRASVVMLGRGRARASAEVGRCCSRRPPGIQPGRSMRRSSVTGPWSSSGRDSASCS